MTSPRLFDRRWRVEVTRATGGTQQTTLDVSELDLSFLVQKDLTRKPNKARVEIWNLSEANRSALAEALSAGARTSSRLERDIRQASGMAGQGDPQRTAEAEARFRAMAGPQYAPVSMRISAGYAEPGMSLIFSGEVTTLRTQRETMDVITVLEGKDARGVLRSARVSRSFAPGTSVEAVTRAVVSAMNIGEGNLVSYVSGLAIDGDRVFREGYAITGTAANALTDLLRPAGLRWSIQDGALQIRRAGQGIEERSILLSPESGLVGTPRPEDRGEISVTALLQPGLTPGQRIVVRSADFEGGYIIRDATFQGDTRGNDWHAHLRARPI